MSKLPVRADSGDVHQQHQLDRRAHDVARRLRRRRAVRHPVQGRAAKQTRVPINYTAYGDESDPARSRSPPNAPVEGGVEQHRRPPRDRRAAAERAISSSSTTRSGAAITGTRRLGCQLEPRVEQAAAARLDVGRCRGAPDLPGPRALQRGPAGPRSHHALRFTGRGDAARLHLSGDALRVVVERPALPPMGLRLRLKSGYSLARFHGRGVGDPQGVEDLRDDRRRQRFLVVHQRRGRPALERHRPRPAQDGPRRQAFQAVTPAPHWAPRSLLKRNFTVSLPSC